MEDETGTPLPQVNFGMQELEGIERLLWGYCEYVQKTATSEQDRHHIQAVETIRGRLAAQLASGASNDVQLFLDGEDLEVLLDALLNFADLIKRVFPKNASRDAVIQSVTVWRLRLTHIISEFDVDRGKP